MKVIMKWEKNIRASPALFQCLGEKKVKFLGKAAFLWIINN